MFVLDQELYHSLGGTPKWEQTFKSGRKLVLYDAALLAGQNRKKRKQRNRPSVMEMLRPGTLMGTSVIVKCRFSIMLRIR
jgi:hypothetical protein